MGLLLWCNTTPETASPSDLIETAERPHTRLHVATEWAWKPQARLHLQHASLHLCRSLRMYLVKQEACSVAAVQLLDGVRFALTKRRKRKEGVFQLSASTPNIVCGAMCVRARQDSSCSLSRCFPCALPTDTRRSPCLLPSYRKHRRAARLLSNPGLFKFKCSVIWKWHEEEWNNWGAVRCWMSTVQPASKTGPKIQLFKGILHPKKENSVIIYAHSCHPVSLQHNRHVNQL